MEMLFSYILLPRPNSLYSQCANKLTTLFNTIEDMLFSIKSAVKI
ncbi:hypothetical protein AC062_0948 [Pasteurellaceae bacterium NI1060]|nr:hypothetical protein AC062_0948 [Pasteurellaceae bacterium NI1060]